MWCALVPKPWECLHPLPVLCSGLGGTGLVADFWQNTQAWGGGGGRFSGAFALAWVLASQCLGPLGLLVVVGVACLLLAPPVALGSGAGGRVSRLTHYLSSLGTAPPSGGGGLFGLFCQAKPLVRTHIQKTFCWMVRSGGRPEGSAVASWVVLCVRDVSRSHLVLPHHAALPPNRWRRKAPMAACHNV